MHMFRGHTRYDSDGTPRIYEVMVNFWGSPIAGRTFGIDVRDDFFAIGFDRCPSGVGSYRLMRDSDIVRMVVITDDVLIGGKRKHIDYIIHEMANKRGLIGHYDPDEFAGWSVRRDRDTHAITLSMPTKIQELCTLLDVSENTKVDSPCVSAAKLDEVVLSPKGDGPRPALDAEQKLCQEATGCLVYITEVRPDILHPVHRATRVMPYPPAEPTLALLRGVAQFLLQTLDDGTTFGGKHDKTNDQLSGGVRLSDPFDMDRPAGAMLTGASDT